MKITEHATGEISLVTDHCSKAIEFASFEEYQTFVYNCVTWAAQRARKRKYAMTGKPHP